MNFVKVFPTIIPEKQVHCKGVFTGQEQTNINCNDIPIDTAEGNPKIKTIEYLFFPDGLYTALIE